MMEKFCTEKGRSYLLVLAVLISFGCQYVIAADNAYLENGVFLGHSFVKYQSAVDKVPELAEKMAKKYDCGYWFVNAGLMDSNGLFVKSSQELAKVVQFLGAVADYEKKSGYKFKILSWYNGDSRTTDLSKNEVRQNIVNECKRFISPDVNGSFVSGSGRSFDGICLDIEPCGQNDILLENYILLVNEISVAIGKDKIVSVCAHKYGTQNSWQWYPEYYYRMAGSVDLIIAMTYNSGSKTAQEYQDWMYEQTRTILNAVSGRYGNDAHPPLNEKVKVMVGFAAYPPSEYHKPDIENAKNGVIGVLRALDELKQDKSQSGKYFLGAAMYLYTDGTGKDNYSSETTDWRDFKQYWLSKP